MDLKSHICLHYRYPTSGKIDPWPFAARHLPVRDIPRSAAANSIDALQDMALAGVGIACLPDFCVEAPIEADLLSPVLEGFLDDSRHLHVVWPASRQPLPRIRAFVEFMAGRAEAGALWRRFSS
jgi:DNA-binding transcriptional LysR family regulator